MNIITISREFGSGGRELAKKLAENLGYDYYDKEIITEIAKRHGVDENYVEYALSNHAWQSFAVSFHHSFLSPLYLHSPDVKLLKEQRIIIEEIAQQNRNFVIVGRNADVLLHKFAPLNLFICADMDDKVKRCMERAEGQEKDLSAKQFKKMIKRIDKNRARARFLISDGTWGHRHSYHATINTTGWNIDKLADSMVSFCNNWFENK